MIGLLDCNNFFVSCERLFRPDLINKPVAVLSSNDGCIVARSQEVKDLGIPMGVPYFQVKDILTTAKATLFSSNFTLYRDISARVMHILKQEVGFCEVYSIDEAFFELSDTVTQEEVIQLRAYVMNAVGIPVSIGVAATKTRAKLASTIAKKENGAYIMRSVEWEYFAPKTQCSAVWGIGRQTSAKLRQIGITTVSEFLQLDRAIVRRLFGVSGERLQSELRGERVFALGSLERPDVPQSIMSTRSFEKTTTTLSELESAVAYHVEEIALKLRKKSLRASKMSIMILPSRHGDFFMQQGTKDICIPEPSSDTKTLLSLALAGLRDIYQNGVPYKKAGIIVSDVIPCVYETSSLFADIQDVQPHREIDIVTGQLAEKFGKGIIHSAVILKTGSRASAKLRSKAYTTQWGDIPTVHAK